ncbi:metallo-beta-lactamase superfamily protein [Rutstroemia sp. NJR-2017a WRK4]|nr:metallo-beta-lactamase superfamily protein [Rutstroemia sp. NJR-2017a WRK4]PQE32306.1 metallo-beta-lactamase superfamily protein [Rutstroemia sp. NJR-2017a WRK4]
MATKLVPLPEVERLSPNVIRILGGNPGKILKETLQKEKATISSCIITHWHHDHVGGIKHLLEHSPETSIYKNTPDNGQLDITDGQKFKTDGATLRAIHSPGHTKDHMALILEEEDAMFTGDNVLGHGTAVFEDLATYLSSLDKMKGLFRGKAYPGHGAIIENGPVKIEEYIKHRKERELQVVQVLKSAKAKPGVAVSNDEEADDWTSMEIVKIIYADVPESLHIPANGGIIQILHKLESEGKIVQKGDRWRIKARAAL